jgi:cytochrome c peroxidase
VRDSFKLRRRPGACDDDCAIQDFHAARSGGFRAYFHNGSKPQFDDVVKFYLKLAQLARQRKLRNGAVEFSGMSLSMDDLDTPKKTDSVPF